MERRNFFKLGLAGAGTLALYNQVKALEYYPMPSDKKWVIVYGTWCGTSRDAAVWISEGMGGIANVFDVRENPDVNAYDNLIIGGSIRAGVTSPELQEFIKKNKALLALKTRGLFAVCGNMRQPVGPKQTENLIDKHLSALSGVSTVPSRVFLGRVTKSLMDKQSATMMKSMEDYDNLKRPECMAFGKEVLEGIKS
jgi:menaquinone-dependent protoporphyrinogen IX oxidase